MDAGGTYGNVFGGRAPMSPAAPVTTNEQYKVNLGRQKTKKWANFKPQNYDGDDWGADNDDAPEADDVPPPPPPSSLKPASSRLPSGPAILSSRQFTPLGGPPQLQLQTSRAVSTPTGPASAGGLLERTAAESLVSPISNIPQSAIAAPSMLSGLPPPAGPSGASLPSRSRPPIASQSAGPAPNMPPPTLPHVSNSPRPGSSAGKTINEARSESPISPITSPAKALPFIRPADIYRRMEEERERQRKSIDSAERPSIDGGRTGPKTHASPPAAVPAQPAPAPAPVPAPTMEDRRAGYEEREESDTGARWIGLPYLPPLIERKSEYGLEGLLASYGSEESVTLPADAPAPALAPEPEAENVSSRTTAADTSDHAKPHSSLLSQKQGPAPSNFKSKAGEEVRPSSTSPKLPELGRLSIFGADFFPISSDFSSVPPVPTITSSPSATTKAMDQSTSSPTPVDTPVTGISNKVAQNDAVLQPGSATAAARPDPSPNRHGEAVESAGRPSHPADPTNKTGTGNIQQQDAAAEASRQAASSIQDKQRPPLPGSWVTETATTPGDLPTPVTIDSAPPRRDQPEAVETARAGESKSDQPAGVTSNSQPSAVDDMGGLSPKKTSSTPSQKDSTVALPPLKSPHSLASTSQPMEASQVAGLPADTYALASPPPRSQAAGGKPTSPISHPESSSYVDIAPTAPLKPGRSTRSTGVQDEYAPLTSISTGLSLDTGSASPVKESDMLREEIMKSLSPLNPSTEFENPTQGPASAYHAAAAEPMRESSYLGDVYDDYWAETTPTPDVPQIPSEPAKNEEGASHSLPEAVSHSPRPLSLAPRDNVAVSATPTAPGEKHPDLRRQFSWETNGARTPGLQASPVRADPASSSSPPEATSAGAPEAPPLTVPELAASPVPAEIQELPGGASYQASEESAAQPRAELDAHPEPPSPVSIRSGENGPRPEDRRLSLAEQKSLIQTSANPVAPSPPLDQHPAVAREQQSQQQADRPPVTPTKPGSLNLMTFRQIMEVPSVNERTKHFNETRFQFAALDTGLDEWTQFMKSQNPEHAKATSSLREGLIEYMAASMPGDSQPDGQNAYSTQHANASTAAFGHMARRPSTNIPMPPPSMHGNSPFGHSGGQVGVKSKKLLLAAGKAGKGLLSKGRHKLSATGEKVFHN